MREHNIKYRRIIYNENKKRVSIRLLLLIISLIVLLSFAVFFIYNYNQISSQVSGTGKAVLEASNSVYNSIAKIIGLSIEDAEQLTEQEKEKQEKTAEQEAAEEGQEQRKSAEQEKEKQEKTAEQEARQEAKQTTEEEINETSEQAEEAETTESEENITKETNITEEINITIPENITEINITIENATEINVTIPEENITIINETLANITEINETAIAENITALNITALNITTKQYKAVINRRVKWIKTFKNENITETKNLILELPKQAENITVKTGEEAREALREIEQYGGVINNTDRNNLITGKVTGYAEIDIRNSKGILTKFINWLKSLTITGNVIQENELQEEITETSESKIINLENIANQTQETEIAIEYYTQAPDSTEENISRGKQVVVSGLDELNYTDVLAYSLLDNRISINNSDKIKIYWIKTESSLLEKETSERKDETNQTTEEITKELAEITENITLPIIDEPTDNETELINNETVGEEEQATEKEINEEATINEVTTEEATTNVAIINETESEQISEQQTSPITAFAINENELNNNDNFSENLNNLTDIDNEAGEQSNIENITASQITKTTREEINFTAYDLDEDGNIDYVEWNVPHLSNQTYEIIYITKAEHLDENYNFIEDVYEQVKEKDDNYTLIPDGDYIRVTFEKPLDKTKDITIYARAKDNCSVFENNFIMINGTEVPCEIYQKKKRIDEIRRILGE